MNIKLFACAAALIIAAQAEAKTPVKHKKNAVKGNFTLVEAFNQKTLSGKNSSAPPPVDDHFIIVWQAATYPETFFWRGQSGFLPCNIEKAHKISSKDAKKYPPGMEYVTEAISGDAIHKGDTLELTPLTRGKYAIPAEIPKDSKQTLYYKTGGSAWQAFPVKTITRKHDLVRP